MATKLISRILAAAPILAGGGAGWNTPSAVVTLACLALGMGITWLGGTDGAVFGVWMGIFAVAAATIAALGRGLFKVEITQVPISTVDPRPVVLMFLSHLTENRVAMNLERDASGAFPLAYDKVGNPLKNRTNIASLEKLLVGASPPKLADLVAANAFGEEVQFSWQQNFRVLASQFGKGSDKLAAGRVFVLTSRESHEQFHIFKEALLRVAAASEVTLDVSEFPNVDPVRLSDMESAIRHIVHELVDEKPSGGGKRWRYDQILVDTTAGSKLTSIAGATTTFASEMVFCYVYNEDVWMLDARASLGKS